MTMPAHDPLPVDARTAAQLRVLADDRERPELRARARIVLEATRGNSISRTAEMLGLSLRTVTKWRQAFQQHGVVGLDQRLRRPLQATQEPAFAAISQQVRAFAAREGRDASTRELAEEMGWSQSKVSRLRRALALQCPASVGALEVGNLFSGRSFLAVEGLFSMNGLYAMSLRFRAAPADTSRARNRHPGLEKAHPALETLIMGARFWGRSGDPEAVTRALASWLRAASAPPEKEARVLLVSSGGTQLESAQEEILQEQPHEWHAVPSFAGWMRVCGSWLGHQRARRPSAWKKTAAAIEEAGRLARPGSHLAWWLS